MGQPLMNCPKASLKAHHQVNRRVLAASPGDCLRMVDGRLCIAER